MVKQKTIVEHFNANKFKYVHRQPRLTEIYNRFKVFNVWYNLVDDWNKLYDIVIGYQ